MKGLLKLIKLRDEANEAPLEEWCSYKTSEPKYAIYTINSVPKSTITYYIKYVLIFKSEKIKNEFLIKNYKLIKENELWIR